MGCAVGLFLPKGSSLRGGDVSGSDTITLDVVFPIFGADVLGEHLQATLGCGIGRYGLATQFTHHGAYVDDLPVTFLDHMGDYSLGNDERTIQVDVDHLAELGCAHLMHRNSFDDAGVVHQDVNHPYLIGNACHELVYLIFVGHVTYVTVCLDTFFQIVGNTLVYQVPV